MIAAIHTNNKTWTAVLFIVLGAVWLNFVLLPCVHASLVESPTTHDCPHCPTPQNDSCHDKSTCDDCDGGFNTLKVQKFDLEAEKNRANFFVLPLKYINDYSAAHQLVEILNTTYLCNNSVPIYLKNCAFLN